MRAQLAEVERFCDRVRSPTVFCHNDLLSGNIMARGVLPGQRFDGATDPGLTFIDFEYGCYNPRGFDLGAALGILPDLLAHALAPRAR